MLREEYFELHKLLKEVIKGSIYVGVKDNEAAVIIKAFKNITYRLRLDEISDKSSVAAMADEIERRYHGFILSKFLVKRSERYGKKENYYKSNRKF